MPFYRFCIRLFCIAFSLSLLHCEQAEETDVVFPTFLSMSWENLPHRLSQLELTANFQDSPASLTTQNDGGDFGSFDYPVAEYRFATNTHVAMSQAHGSVDLLISPSEDHASSDAFLTTTTVEIPTSELNSATNAAAMIRGFRIDTDRYDSPPEFSEREELPYEPALGYTTSGFGISISQPKLVGSHWEFTIQARNRLGIGDRPDMNLAMQEALSWIRVDYTIIGAPNSVHIDYATTSYTQSHQEFGANTEHPAPSAEEQQIQFAPRPDTNILGYGLTGFDITVNVPGAYDSESCTPEHEELNAWGESVGGPGRYIRSFTAGIHSISHDSGKGDTSAQINLHFSNSSALREIGNLCLGLRGSAALYRSTLPAVNSPQEVITKLDYTSGELYNADI